MLGKGIPRFSYLEEHTRFFNKPYKTIYLTNLINHIKPFRLAKAIKFVVLQANLD